MAGVFCNQFGCQIVDPNLAGFVLWDCNVAVSDVSRSLIVKEHTSQFYVFYFSFQSLDLKNVTG